ncbi:PLP-dependent aminotransferase family protein [Sphingopyxis sp. JAI128]|uniref:MocR-like pyridoxine biosynthesis transcription factor PdxR n=1 Tax=Sphingopyxis sp. JAI128 TaxID=2723066 RepID=UPI00161F5C9C|nr:PLP-dependent aminotransferase family protein [Sphingopyxis sp. JAI128]MBB6426097.1 GntR family transcriptional regulator/MocR family aminotransferase [Sphingopyxis sp. JAI128]
MSAPWDGGPVAITIDRSQPTPITVQITNMLRAAIVEGRLRPGTRLPSWLDMAAQLGVSRGTVKAAYETLADELLVYSAGAAGTRVAERAPPRPTAVKRVVIRRPLESLERGFSVKPLPFQMGVPAQDAFPHKLWARLRARAVRANAMAPVGPPDPRGEPELRAQVAAQLAITRGICCHPDQIILTSGYRNGLSLTLLALGVQGRTAWVEDPGYPVTRMALDLAGLKAVPIPVDAKGIRVDHGIRAAPDAALAIVTPGQQAPTGVTLSPERRRALLAWAAREDAWIVEDDYLSELQLGGRAAPAMAADDPAGRVIHIGTFGKTISPSLGLGFVVAPLGLAERFGEIAGCLNPAPNVTTQLALADFLADGHFLRHLRHMKALYRQRRDDLHARLDPSIAVDAFAGLAIVAHLPRGFDDVALAQRAPNLGIAPCPLSVWHADPAVARPGLLLCVTNVRPQLLDKACNALATLIDDPAAAHTPARAA